MHKMRFAMAELHYLMER